MHDDTQTIPKILYPSAIQIEMDWIRSDWASKLYIEFTFQKKMYKLNMLRGAYTCFVHAYKQFGFGWLPVLLILTDMVAAQKRIHFTKKATWRNMIDSL